MTDPVTSIPFATVAEFIAQLGFESNEVEQITMRTGHVEVVRFRHDEGGHRYVVAASTTQQKAATETIDIAIDYEQQP